MLKRTIRTGDEEEWRRMLARLLAMALCPSVSLSVTSRCSIEVAGRIELVFGMEAFFDQSYTVL